MIRLNILLKICIYLILLQSFVFTKNYYNFRNSLQKLLGNAHFRVVSYVVQTSDRYLITVDRFVASNLTLNSSYTSTHKPILLIPGISGTSAQFFMNEEESDGKECGENMGFCLLKTERYDVWSLNVRGNGISAAHLDLDVYDNEFWDFSFDQIGRFDLPATIDLILSESGHNRLSILGYSYGTVSALALLSLHPEWSEKVYPLVLWGPVPYMAHMKSIVTPFIPLAKFVIPQSRATQNPASMNPNFLVGEICKTFGVICGLFQQLTHGPTEQFNNSRWSVYMHFTPAGSSTSDILHLAQIYLAKNFTRFDYGNEKNRKMYGQDKAPFYPLNNITNNFNIFIAYGQTDAFAQPSDVKRLIDDLRFWKLNIQEWLVPSNTWNHFNFVAGINATHLLNRPTLQYLDRFY